ncbi:hypothetical protein HDU97_007245 [Phlyctochytrium planicorne]|nr:hypothetical protein HDU97_007245 [Phlyctochytrium planicorne]
MSSIFRVTVLALASAFLFASTASSQGTPITIDQRVLILTTGGVANSETPIYSLKSYSIPYTVLDIQPPTGIVGNLTLETADGTGALYSLLVMTVGSMAADFGGGVFKSVLTDAQWNQIYAYQAKYNVRLVVLNDIPGNAGALGATSRANDNWGTSDEQPITITSADLANKAGLKTSTPLASTGLYHTPGNVVNGTMATSFISFAPSAAFTSVTSAGVIYNFSTTAFPREQMSFFLPFGSWSPTSLILSHIWIQWGTRGTYNGFRRVLMTPTIDDYFLFTEGFDEKGKAVTYRTSIPDMDGIQAWQKDINSRLPAGSLMRLELAFNGNGILEAIDRIKTSTSYALSFDPDLTEGKTDLKKEPLGSGITLWPNPAPSKTAYRADLPLDTLYKYFNTNKANIDAFWWNSHTFTHEILNNNTFSDTLNEISFNYDMAQQIGLTTSAGWSNFSMVTPGISGLFNGDALRALTQFGITAAVGDTSRPKTTNLTNPEFWPMITSVDVSGFAGFTVIPRSATNVFFNCTNPVYNTQIYHNIYANAADQTLKTKPFAGIIDDDVQRVTRMLLGLSWVPYMFHQANLRNADITYTFVNPGNGKTEKLSLVSYWVESVLANFYKYTNWPIISYKSDEFTSMFQKRAIYENCGVRTFFSGYRNVTTGQVYVTTLNAQSTQTCSAPFTVPVAASNIAVSGSTFKTEQLGADPLTVWVDMKPNTPVAIQIQNSALLA